MRDDVRQVFVRENEVGYKDCRECVIYRLKRPTDSHCPAIATSTELFRCRIVKKLQDARFSRHKLGEAVLLKSGVN